MRLAFSSLSSLCPGLEHRPAQWARGPWVPGVPARLCSCRSTLGPGIRGPSALLPRALFSWSKFQD